MRICFDLTSLEDNLSGIERYAACISLEMIKSYFEEYILVFKKEIHPMFASVCKQDNVQYILLPECNKLLFLQIRLPFALRKICADWFIFLAFPVPLLSFKRNMVETIHDITAWDYPRTMKNMMSWYFKISHLVALKKCKAIVTISEFSKKRIIDRLKYSKKKIWLIYCGINNQQFIVNKEKFHSVKKKYHLPDKYLLSLSTLEPRKNLPLLIHAYEELIKDNKQVIPLVLAGRKGWKMEELLSSIDDSVKEQIYFTGFIDDEDLPEVYALADFFVFPSMYEGFGMPPLEAMACGTPTLSSDAASLPEVLGNAAVYFKSNDMDQLKEKLIQVSNMQRSEYDKLVILGLQQVKQFNWKIEAGNLYSHLKVLEKHNTVKESLTII